MQVSISSGGHVPDLPYMVVDGHGMLVNLSNIEGELLDRVVSKVTWGPIVVNGEAREGGTILRQDGTRQPFWDVNLLSPYLKAWRAVRAIREQEQADYRAGPQATP
jgi:hypothetical protein